MSDQPTREQITAAAKAVKHLYFPPSPSCYGCAGRGYGFGAAECSCTLHEAGECDPDGCSPECKRRAEMRDEGPWAIEAQHPDAPDVLVRADYLTHLEASFAAFTFANAGCHNSFWPMSHPPIDLDRTVRAHVWADLREDRP